MVRLMNEVIFMRFSFLCRPGLLKSTGNRGLELKIGCMTRAVSLHRGGIIFPTAIVSILIGPFIPRHFRRG